MSTTKANDTPKKPNEPVYRPIHHLVLECRDEDEQRDLFEEMTTRGLRCRVVTL